MKQLSHLLIILSLFLVACNDKKGAGSYYNDFESMGYWSDLPTIKKGIAHSGQFCTFTDSTAEYSAGMKLPVGDMKVAKPYTITATAWVMANDLNAKAQLVLNLDSAGKSVAWSGTQTQTVIQAPGKWVGITCTVNVPANVTPDEKLFVFGWAGGKQAVYFDDVQLTIE